MLKYGMLQAFTSLMNVSLQRKILKNNNIKKKKKVKNIYYCGHAVL